MSQIPDAVRALERELRGIFGTRLESLVLYGGASPHRDVGEGHHAHETPLVHTMAIVQGLTPEDLRGCATRVSAWHDSGLATPLVLASHEFERSLDAFPFEFGGIIADHQLVAGTNPFDGIAVDAADLRRSCEVQARSHLLHLREGYIETRGRSDALAVLIVRSARPFAALARHVARLDGHPTLDAAAAARHLERTLQLPGMTASEVVALVGVAEMSSTDADRLFLPYLEAMDRLVTYVDRWTPA